MLLFWFIQLTGFGVSSWGAKPLFIENEVVSSEMDGITERLWVEGLKISGLVLDVALLFTQPTA